jgi:hypothetical protein
MRSALCGSGAMYMAGSWRAGRGMQGRVRQGRSILIIFNAKPQRPLRNAKDSENDGSFMIFSASLCGLSRNHAVGLKIVARPARPQPCRIKDIVNTDGTPMGAILITPYVSFFHESLRASRPRHFS